MYAVLLAMTLGAGVEYSIGSAPMAYALDSPAPIVQVAYSLGDEVPKPLQVPVKEERSTPGPTTLPAPIVPPYATTPNTCQPGQPCYRGPVAQPAGSPYFQRRLFFRRG